MKVEILSRNVIRLINEEEKTGILVVKTSDKIVFSPACTTKDNEVFIKKNDLMYVTVYLFFNKVKDDLKTIGTLMKSYVKERDEIVLRNCDGAVTNRILIRKEAEGFLISLKNIDGANVVVELGKSDVAIATAFQTLLESTMKKVKK